MPLQTIPILSKIRQSIALRSEFMTKRNYLKTTHRLQKIGFDPVQVDKRLLRVESEWSIDRALMAHAALVFLGGLALAKTVHKKYYLMPAAVGGFLMQYALTGWSPPFEIFRTFGFRTAQEIDAERNALKALRGDYNYTFSAYSPLDAFHAALK